MTDYQVKLDRLQRKLDKKDIKIEGLNKRIKELERLLIYHKLNLTTKNIENAVQHALCNVRMIPVLGFGKDSSIVEIRHIKPENDK